jgi:hypothetical protein
VPDANELKTPYALSVQDHEVQPGLEALWALYALHHQWGLPAEALDLVTISSSFEEMASCPGPTATGIYHDGPDGEGIQAYVGESGTNWRVVWTASDGGGRRSPARRTHDPMCMLAANWGIKDRDLHIHRCGSCGQSCGTPANDVSGAYWVYVMKRGVGIYTDSWHYDGTTYIEHPISELAGDGAELTDVTKSWYKGDYLDEAEQRRGERPKASHPRVITIFRASTGLGDGPAYTVRGKGTYLSPMQTRYWEDRIENAHPSPSGEEMHRARTQVLFHEISCHGCTRKGDGNHCDDTDCLWYYAIRPTYYSGWIWPPWTDVQEHCLSDINTMRKAMGYEKWDATDLPNWSTLWGDLGL